MKTNAPSMCAFQQVCADLRRGNTQKDMETENSRKLISGYETNIYKWHVTELMRPCGI